jgi:hypothetical protein
VRLEALLFGFGCRAASTAAADAHLVCETGRRTHESFRSIRIRSRHAPPNPEMLARTPTQPWFSEPKSGIRVSSDSLIQASLVDLFKAYGVALAPMPRSAFTAPTVPEVSVAAAFRSGAGVAGKLTLSLPAALLEHMKGDEVTSVRMDWARELASQLVGRIKNRLLPFGIRVEIGPLTLLDPKLIQHQRQDLSGQRVYVGRTLRGLVVVSLQGLPDDSALSYVGGVGATEGTLLWL